MAGPAAGSSPRWKPVAAIAGSALGGALIAFLISWAVIGHDGSSDRLPISSSEGRSAQGQAPTAGSGSDSGSASGSTSQGPGRRQGQSGSGSASGSTGQSQSGSMPSARSGAS